MVEPQTDQSPDRRLLPDVSRRGFLKGAVGVGAAAAIGSYEVFGIEPEVAVTPADAIELALSLSTEGDAILVAGSLYVAGAVRDRVLVQA